MPVKRFRTRYGYVTIPVRKKNPKKGRGKAKKKQRRKARAKVRKTAKRSNPVKKTLSKKVGRWRVECKGRTVYAAGAKHGYKDSAAAKSAYKRMTSVKSVENFVSRYGKKATKKAVTGMGKKRKATKKASRKPAKKAKQSRRRNVPISAAQAATIRKVLRAHGY